MQWPCIQDLKFHLLAAQELKISTVPISDMGYVPYVYQYTIHMQ